MIMTYKIDNDIPIPEFNAGRVSKYPWSKLERVGQSFFVPEHDLTPKHRPDLPEKLKRLGYKTKSMKVTETYNSVPNVSGIRTWLIAKGN